jgi:hypothetical protein
MWYLGTEDEIDETEKDLPKYVANTKPNDSHETEAEHQQSKPDDTPESKGYILSGDRRSLLDVLSDEVDDSSDFRDEELFELREELARIQAYEFIPGSSKTVVLDVQLTVSAAFRAFLENGSKSLHRGTYPLSFQFFRCISTLCYPMHVSLA